MSNKLTLEQIKEKVFKNTLETCDYISGYETVNSTVKLKCRKHNYEFETKWDNVKRSTRAHYVCPICIQENREKKKIENNTNIEVECAYCHKKFLKLKSRLKNSKSGLYFCCREHKDLAQKLDSGKKFDILRPEHYGKLSDSSYNYREKAFREYEHKCAICNYNEEPKILQVHHIDENRQNNSIDNLIILCPNCHAKITYGNYTLKDRKKLIKQNE